MLIWYSRFDTQTETSSNDLLIKLTKTIEICNRDEFQRVKHLRKQSEILEIPLLLNCTETMEHYTKIPNKLQNQKSNFYFFLIL